jgi:hypothetical protein
MRVPLNFKANLLIVQSRKRVRRIAFPLRIGNESSILQHRRASSCQGNPVHGLAICLCGRLSRTLPPGEEDASAVQYPRFSGKVGTSGLPKPRQRPKKAQFFLHRSKEQKFIDCGLAWNRTLG